MSFSAVRLCYPKLVEIWCSRARTPTYNLSPIHLSFPTLFPVERAVSYVPPAYYAHLAAAQGRLNVMFGEGGTAASSTADSSGSGNASYKPVHEALAGTCAAQPGAMYFI